MLTADRIRIAAAWRERANHEFNYDPMLAPEILWGAVAQAIIAIAAENGWPANSHGAFRVAVRRLAHDYGAPTLITFFDSAEKLHGNFYHHNLPAGEMPRRWRQAEMLVSSLLGLLN